MTSMIETQMSTMPTSAPAQQQDPGQQVQIVTSVRESSSSHLRSLLPQTPVKVADLIQKVQKLLQIDVKVGEFACEVINLDSPFSKFSD